MDKGICVSLPGSAAKGFKFTMISLNITKILENELKGLNRTRKNITWGMIEQKENQAWRSDGTWVECSKALCQLPNNSAWENLWNHACYWSLHKGSDMETSNVTPVSVPCTIVLWWDSLSGSGYFEQEYDVCWNTDWCIQIPDKPGEIHLNCTRYEWAWSLKQLFNATHPFSSTSDLPSGTTVQWEVGLKACMHNQVKLPSGETPCRGSGRCRSIDQDMMGEPC